MGGTGSGRRPKGSKYGLTLEEKIERNRVRARERWQRLRDEKENSPELKGNSLYKLNLKVKYHNDEERLGYLREPSTKLRVNEYPHEYLQYLRKKNADRLDEILNDAEAMERIFADRDDIPTIQKNAQRHKNYYSAKEIAEMERKLNEEFNLIEDRRPSQSTYKKQNEETND